MRGNPICLHMLMKVFLSEKYIALPLHTINSLDVKKGVLINAWDQSSCMNITLHHNMFSNVTQRMPMCRNANVHNYNNYFNDSSICMSSRVTAYFFNEANYFGEVGAAYYEVGSGEAQGAIKSFGDMYINLTGTEFILSTIVKDREAYVENKCKPDWINDYSRFDTDPNLSCYNAENKCTDVELLHKAEDVPEFVKTYADAGVYKKLELSAK